MKKIVQAWIEQILQFDCRMEYLAYIEGLKEGNIKFKVIEQHQTLDGKVTLRIRKQYNKNNFPDE